MNNITEWLTPTETGEWFGVDYRTFKKELPELQKRGFPKAGAFGKFYIGALRDWAARIYNLAPDPANDEQADPVLVRRLRELEDG